MCTFVIGMLSIEIIVFFESQKSRLSWSYDKQNIHTRDHFIISLTARFIDFISTLKVPTKSASEIVICLLSHLLHIFANIIHLFKCRG